MFQKHFINNNYGLQNLLFKIPVGESVAKFTQGFRRTRKVSQATWSQGSLRKCGRVSPGSERNVEIESLSNGNKTKQKMHILKRKTMWAFQKKKKKKILYVYMYQEKLLVRFLKWLPNSTRFFFFNK